MQQHHDGSAIIIFPAWYHEVDDTDDVEDIDDVDDDDIYYILQI